MGAKAALKRHLLSHGAYVPLFERLHGFSLQGLGFGNDDAATNGERLLLDRLARAWAGREPVVFDVGANVGAYAAELLRRFHRIRLHCFEPAPEAFARLSATLDDARASLHPYGLGARQEQVPLYAPPDASASTLASVHARQLGRRGIEMLEAGVVELRPLDDVCAQLGVDEIDFLKLDVEGHELAVLDGSAGLLADRRIRLIQFEFGGTGLDARIYLRDFFDRLEPGYEIRRVLPSGLLRLPAYRERLEVFEYANYVAVRRGEPLDL